MKRTDVSKILCWLGFHNFNPLSILDWATDEFPGEYECSRCSKHYWDRP